MSRDRSLNPGQSRKKMQESRQERWQLPGTSISIWIILWSFTPKLYASSTKCWRQNLNVCIVEEICIWQHLLPSTLKNPCTCYCHIKFSWLLVNPLNSKWVMSGWWLPIDCNFTIFWWLHKNSMEDSNTEGSRSYLLGKRTLKIARKRNALSGSNSVI